MPCQRDASTEDWRIERKSNMLGRVLQRCKQWAKTLPYPVFLRLFYLWFYTVQMTPARLERRRARLPLLAASAVQAVKTSDRLFILGGGSSINRMGPERWEAISRHDTVGLNWWTLHPFVPRIYFFENFGQESPPGALELQTKAFTRRSDEYAETVKVAMELPRTGAHLLEELPAAFRRNLYAAYSLQAPARTPGELTQALKYLARTGAFERDSHYKYLFKYASSVTAILTLAIKVGYRKVVLCGFDLHDQDYFFFDRELYPETADLDFMPRNQPHDSNVATKWRIPAVEAILTIREALLQPAGIELFVESSGSALHPQVPLAPEETFC